MDTIGLEFEKVVKKQKTISGDTITQLDTLISRIESTQKTLSEQPSTLQTTLSTLKPYVKQQSSKVIESHKELFSTMSKFSKWLEKHKMFKTDLDAVWNPGAIDGKEDILNKAIALHFVREGKFKLSDIFAREAGLVLEDDIKVRFQEMYQVVQDLQHGQLDSAIHWCQVYQSELDKRHSSLEFQLHRAKFIMFIKAGSTKDALLYSKAHFDRFKQKHAKEIQKLMATLIYVKRLDKCPYKDMFNSHLLSDLQHAFTKNFCQLLGLSSESPLFTSVTVGASALPTIIKMTSILKDQAGMEWSQNDELAVEIPLLDSQRFHSVFSCPVSKEQATEENPAMLMACGHVIVKESLNRLSKGNNMARFKCPYCPTESTASQAIQIFF